MNINLGEILVFLALILAGTAVIMILRTILHFLLPIVAAIVTWMLTGNLVLAGVMFVVVALIELIFTRR